MDEVESRHLVVSSRRLESNPVINAAKEVFDALRSTIDEVSLRGETFLIEGRDRVVQIWEQQRTKLQDRAADALALFQAMMSDLLQTLISSIARLAPHAIKEGYALDELSFKMTLSASPSVGLAVQEVLKLATSAGVEFTFTYKAAGGSTEI